MIGGKFKLGRKIGSGSFGELYLGIMLIHGISCLPLIFIIDLLRLLSLLYAVRF